MENSNLRRTNAMHQVVAANLEREIQSKIRNPACKVMRGAKYDWGLDKVYEPDISILCGEANWEKPCFEDVPRFIAEILTDESENEDRYEKMMSYAEAGVEEYWLVDCRVSECRIERYMLSDDGSKFLLHDIVYGKDGEEIAIIVFQSVCFRIRDLLENENEY